MINGAGGRRNWSTDDKARIVAEALELNATISKVARRYGLRPEQIFAWRREARKPAASVQQASPTFVRIRPILTGADKAEVVVREDADPVSFPHEPRRIDRLQCVRLRQRNAAAHAAPIGMLPRHATHTLGDRRDAFDPVRSGKQRLMLLNAGP